MPRRRRLWVRKVDRWIAGSRLVHFTLHPALHCGPGSTKELFHGMATKQEQELNLFELASAKLSDAQKLVAEAHDLLRQDPKQCETRKVSHRRNHKNLE